MSIAPRSLVSSKGVGCAQSRLSIASRIHIETAQSPLLSFSRKISTALPSSQSLRHTSTIQQLPYISAFRFLSHTTRSATGVASRSFTTSSRNAASSPPTEPAGEEYVNPYKAKRKWPPDMSKLSPKQQFRLERKYRRRSKQKWARPTWTKWTKLVQWGLIGFVLVYAVLFMEMKDSGPNPFQGFRDYVKGLLDDSVLAGRRPALRNESTSPAGKTESQ
ncbi:hypothetical protein MGYG_06845 [Nannizzia gypsea CBS 118893]|uniref:Uncharacterized protein n=1 Tax=Arthroderma gypseum (strain ATCC MYA-4604 / CBS 118893) TaxID=535722 RepID=E4V1D0_ARTGP|nr:hypothetical protein MGYG_06845 [Nannizzia gypsea CBS 118893]EFR03845.1 hypothetical protein MGYG_06845 [Nannizzia gypsea CBS 118893]